MPHIVIEYSSNLSTEAFSNDALEELNVLLGAFESIKRPDLKSRARACDAFHVGDPSSALGFVHLQLSLLPGRSPALKKEISEALLAFLKSRLEANTKERFAVSVELRELEGESYSKCFFPE